MYPEDNIFDLHRRLGKKLPFRVRRLACVPYGKTIDDYRNTSNRAFLVTEVIPQGKYGVACGFQLDKDGNTKVKHYRRCLRKTEAMLNG